MTYLHIAFWVMSCSCSLLSSSALGQARRASDAELMAHGISHELAVRRSRALYDVRYELHLDVTALDSTVGRVRVRFGRTGKDDLILDWRGRHITSIAANAVPELLERPVQSMSGTEPLPLRTQVLLWYEDRVPVTLPVELRARTTTVTGVAGLPAPAFVFANYQDYGYFLTLLDSTSTRSLLRGAIGRVADPFLRTMLWGALWDQVRDARLSPADFTRLLLAEVPNETDEQIIPVLAVRLERSMRAYLSPLQRERLRPEAERVLWDGARNDVRAYGSRKAMLDAFIAVAATSDGILRLHSLLAADSAADEPVRDPTRWDVVQRLFVLDAAEKEAALDHQSARDTTPDGLVRAFIVGAARKSAAVKHEYFARYFADRKLNEDWASRSLGAFNAIEQQELTLPFLGPALDSLPFIQANRRIFFLGSWLGAFLNGQDSEQALDVVREFLSKHPRLAADLRQKVLQSADELERTVRIRKRWS